MRFKEFFKATSDMFSEPPSKVGPVATDIANLWKLEKPFFTPPQTKQGTQRGNTVSRRWKTNPLRPAGELHKSVGQPKKDMPRRNAAAKSLLDN